MDEIRLPCAPEHVDVGLSVIQASPTDETYRLCVPIYVYFRTEDKEQAAALSQQIEEQLIDDT